MNKKKKYLLSGISLGIVTVATTVGLMFGFANSPSSSNNEYTTINSSQEFFEQTEVSDEQYFLLHDQQSGKYLSDVNSDDFGYAYWTSEESIYGYSIVNSSEEGYINIVSSNPENINKVLTISENNNIYWATYDEATSENQNLVILHNEKLNQYSVQFENGLFLNLSNISQQSTDTMAVASETETPSWFAVEKLPPVWLDVNKLDYLGNYKVEIGLHIDSSYTGPQTFAIIPNKDDDSVGGEPYAEVFTAPIGQNFSLTLDYSQWGVNPEGEYYTVQLVYGSVDNRSDIATVTMEPADIEIQDVRYVGATIEVDYAVTAKTPQNDTNITNNIGSTNNKIYARLYDSTIAAPDSNTGWEEITPVGYQGETSTWTNGATVLPEDDFIIEFSSNDVSFDDPNDVDAFPDKGYTPSMAYDNQALIPASEGPWVQVSIHEVYGFIDITNGAPTFTYNYSYDAITNRESHEMIINYEVNYMDSQNWVEIRISGDDGTTWTSFVDGTSSLGLNTITLNILPELTASAYKVQLRVSHNETPTGSVWVDAVDTNSDYDGDGLPDTPVSKTKKEPSYIRVL